MSIRAFCSRCKSTFEIGIEACPKCLTPLPRTGRKFRVRLTVNGKTVSRLAPNLTVARAISGTIGGELVSGEYIDRRKKIPVPRLDAVWRRYLRDNGPEVKAIKVDADRYERHLKPRFGKMTLDKITGDQIENFRADLSEATNRWGRPFAPGTVANILELLRRLIRAAIKLGIFKGTDPFASVRFPRKNNEVDQPMNPEEFRRLVATADNFEADPTFGAFVRFLCFTGCRRNEALRLKWDDIRGERATLRDTKAGRKQTLTLNAGALESLRMQEPRTKAAGGLIFPSDAGKVRTNTHFQWARLKVAAGLPERLRLHDIRHSVATLLAASGRATIDDIRGILRHADARVTAKYMHHLPGHLQKVTSILDDIAADPDTPLDEKILNLDEARRRRGA